MPVMTVVFVRGEHDHGFPIGCTDRKRMRPELQRVGLVRRHAAKAILQT